MDQRSTTGGNVQQGQQSLQGPLSFRAFLGFKLDRDEAGNQDPVHVQFRKRGLTFCGTVVQAAPGDSDTDWFQVDGQLGVCWVPHKNVRLCSGDGRCVCEAEAPGADAASRSEDGDAPGAVPLGNTGTTVVVKQ